MPTVTRKILDGPSRENLFDSLRLGTRVEFDAALSKTGTKADVTRKSAQEVLELAIGELPYYVCVVTGIRSCGATRNLWSVEAELVEADLLATDLTFTVTLTITSYNTKSPRDSGELTVTCETTQVA